MSLKLVSCTDTRFDTSQNTRKISATSNSIHSCNPYKTSDTITQQAGIKKPLEAALAVKSKYIKTLHESLFKFLDDVAKKLTKLSELFYKNVKYQVNCSDLAHLPKSIKHIGLVTLQWMKLRSEGLHKQSKPSYQLILKQQGVGFPKKVFPPSRQLTLSCSQNAVPNNPFADCLHLLHLDLSRKFKIPSLNMKR